MTLSNTFPHKRLTDGNCAVNVTRKLAAFTCYVKLRADLIAMRFAMRHVHLQAFLSALQSMGKHF